MFAGIRLVAFGLVLVALSCVPLPELANGQIRGVVVVSTPVHGALVTAWRLDPDTGERIERLAEVRTDPRSGEFAFDIGTARGAIELVAIGGTTLDLVSGADIALDRALRCVLVDVEAGEVRPMAITPYSTLAAALGDQRAGPGRSYTEVMGRAYEFLGDHLGFDLGRTQPADVRGSVALDLSGRYALALAALSGLAARMARESLGSERGVSTLDLLQALLEDAAGPRAILDGMGPDGLIQVGACASDPVCPLCPTVCDLDSNTLRADLGAALVYEFILTEENITGLEAGDVLPLVERWRGNEESALFGGDAIEPITGEPPMVIVGMTTVSDESEDTVEFPNPDTAIPVHTPSGSVTVLGPGPSCETVSKHVTRLDDPLDNPVRWEFSVVGAGIVPDSGAYRVGIREPAGIQWLTTWRPAMARASITNGHQYEVLLLRSNLPELGTRQGRYEIEFRGRDAFGQLGTAGRCWQHEILPPRLWYSAASAPPATALRSLETANLDPGNNLAPLLNGVPVAQGKALMEFDIRNGTKEPAYVTFAYDQAVATYQKSWQDGYAYLFTDDTVDATCLGDGTCTSDPVPAPQYVDTQGTIDQVVSALLIWDYAAGAYLQRCASCGADEYRIEPRLSSATPRRYRVMLIATDLGALAPVLPQGDSETGPFEDFTLDPMLPLQLTGRQYDRLKYCADPDMGVCLRSRTYRHYRALTGAWLSVAWLRVTGRAGAVSSTPGPLAIERELPGFSWMTSEPVVPPTSP
jgi:hypothetical protein